MALEPSGVEVPVTPSAETTDLEWLEEIVGTAANLLAKAREDNKRAKEILKGAFDEEAIDQLEKEIDIVHTNLTQLYYDEAVKKFEREDEDAEGSKKLSLSRSFNARAVMQVGEDTEQMRVTLARAWDVDAAVSVIMKIHSLDATLEEAEKSLLLLKETIRMELEYLGARLSAMEAH